MARLNVGTADDYAPHSTFGDLSLMLCGGAWAKQGTASGSVCALSQKAPRVRVTMRGARSARAPPESYPRARWR